MSEAAPELALVTVVDADVTTLTEEPEGVVMVRVEPLIEAMVPTVPGPPAMPKGPPLAPPAPGAAPGPPGVPTEVAAVWAVAA